MLFKTNTQCKYIIKPYNSAVTESTQPQKRANTHVTVVALGYFSTLATTTTAAVLRLAINNILVYVADSSFLDA